jgi:hypothetical protein
VLSISMSITLHFLSKKHVLKKNECLKYRKSFGRKLFCHCLNMVWVLCRLHALHKAHFLSLPLFEEEGYMYLLLSMNPRALIISLYATILAGNHVLSAWNINSWLRAWPEIKFRTAWIPLGLDILFSKRARIWRLSDFIFFFLAGFSMKTPDSMSCKVQRFLLVICFIDFHLKSACFKKSFSERQRIVIVSLVVLWHFFLGLFAFSLYFISFLVSSVYRCLLSQQCVDNSSRTWLLRFLLCSLQGSHLLCHWKKNDSCGSLTNTWLLSRALCASSLVALL